MKFLYLLLIGLSTLICSLAFGKEKVTTNTSDAVTVYKAKEVLKEHEGLRLCAYPDGKKGHYSVGYGNQFMNGVRVEKGTCITRHMADLMLENRIKKDLKLINDLSKKIQYKLTVNKKIALLSLTYNLGYREGVLIRIIIAKKPCKIFKKYSYVNGKFIKGLRDRRNAECKLFLKLKG